MARILRSPVYIGQVPYHDEVHAGEHRPLIEDETFQKTVRRLLGGGPTVTRRVTRPICDAGLPAIAATGANACLR
ncbi:MAG: hypothetical protein JW940_04665 [Polyangiaceae bacterium]|nr:hypothetical protein [Polyangiaceae bacterium]